MFERTQSRLVLFLVNFPVARKLIIMAELSGRQASCCHLGWFTSGPTPNYQWSTVIYIWCAKGGSPTVGQQRLSGHANGGPTTHLSFGVPLGQRWANRGPPVASHRGPTVGQQRPTGGYSHRWANRGSLDKPTVGHRWLPPLAQQRTYRWCTVGPPLANGG